MSDFSARLSSSNQDVLRALQNASKNSARWREQLATDSGINRAGDAPAAASALDRLSLQSRGSAVAAQNISQAINLTQTVDRGLENVLKVAHSMRETTLEALNSGTLTRGDRAALNEEFGALREGLTFLQNTTRFNGMNLFSDRQAAFQVGYERDDRLEIDLKSFSLLETAMNLWQGGGYVWSSATGDSDTSAYARTKVDDWYAALDLNPARFFLGLPSNTDTALTDGARALDSEDYTQVLSVARNRKSVKAQPLSFQNASFEAEALEEGKWTNNAVTGWEMSPGAAYTSVAGANVARIDDNGGSIRQTLKETYNANNSYSITLALGDERLSGGAADAEEGADGLERWGPGADYTAILYAGNTMIGSMAGATGDNDGLKDITFHSVLKDSSLNGQALSLEIVKTGGDALVIDNVRGTATKQGALNKEDDASWELSLPGSDQSVTYTLGWDFTGLVSQVNADTATTGWAAQLSPINTTRAFDLATDGGSDRELTLSSDAGDSRTFTLAANAAQEDVLALVNAEYGATGIKAVAEGNQVRFLSEANLVSVTLDGETKTLRKAVEFYRPGGDGEGATVTYRGPGGDVQFESTLTAVRLQGGVNGEDPGEARNAEEALTLLNNPGANFVLSVLDDFIDELGERRGYYGGVMNSLERALDQAEAAEDQALRTSANYERIDRAEVYARAIESDFLLDASLAAFSQSNARRASTLELLMFQPRGFGFGF
jgi:flagellin-like hook-associated protein FlgL